MSSSISSSPPPPSLESVVAVLSSTFGNGPMGPTEAENHLHDMEKCPGYYSILLQILTLPPHDCPLNVQLSAALRLKNTIIAHWDLRRKPKAKKKSYNALEDDSPISSSDRHIIRSNVILTIIHNGQHLIVSHLLDVVFMIARPDWPERWPQSMPQILDGLQSSTKPHVILAASALRKIYKAFELKNEADRQPIYKLTKEIFPSLFKLMVAVHQDDSVEAIELTKRLVKIFHSVTRFAIPPDFRRGNEYFQWVSIMINLMDRPFPQSLRSSDESKMSPSQLQLHYDNHPFWKLRKWCTKVLLAGFCRFGRPSKVITQALKPFAKQYADKVSGVVLNHFFDILVRSRTSNEFIGERVELNIYRYLDCALSIPSMFKFLLSKSDILLRDCIFKSLAMSPVDVEMMESDPMETVRRNYSLSEQFKTVNIAVVTFLLNFMKKERGTKKFSLMQKAVELCVSVMQQNDSLPPNERNPIVKEAAMTLFGVVRVALFDQGDHHFAAIEEVLIRHVGAELSSPHPYLQSRACWLFNRYARIPWQNKELQREMLELLCRCVRSGHVGVQVESISALEKFIKFKSLRELIKPLLPELLQTLFSLISQIGSAHILCTLKSIVSDYHDDVEPFAVQMTTQLAEFFLMYMGTDASDNDDVDGAEENDAGDEILSTLRDIVFACRESDIIPKLEPIIFSVLQAGYRKLTLLHIEGIMDLHSTFIYAYPGEGISPPMIEILSDMFELREKAKEEFLYFTQSCTALLDNYIARFDSKDLTRPIALNLSFIDFVWSLSSTIIMASHEDEEENRIFEERAVYGAWLLFSLLASHRFKIDPVAVEIVRLVSTKLLASKLFAFQLLLIDVLAGAAYYNPALFLHTLAEMGADRFKKVFNMWMSIVEQMKGVMIKSAMERKQKFGDDEEDGEEEDGGEDGDDGDVEDENGNGDSSVIEAQLSSTELASLMRHEKNAVRGFSSLLLVPIDSMPPILSEALGDVVVLVVNTLESLTEEYKECEDVDDEEEDEDADPKPDDAVWNSTKYEGDGAIEEIYTMDGIVSDGEDDFQHDGEREWTAELPNGRGRNIHNDDDDEEDEKDNNFMDQIRPFLDYEIHDELHEFEFDTPVDAINEFIFFQDAMNHLRKEETPWVMKFMEVLQSTPKDMERFVRMMAESDEHRKREMEEEEEMKKKESEGN